MKAHKQRLWAEMRDNTNQAPKVAQAQRKLDFLGDNTLERCFGELRGIPQSTILGENSIQNPPQSSLKNK